MHFPDKVTVCEVGPRDGLQNERVNVSTADKIRIIEALAVAGIRLMEATSFVSPKWIPNLADAEEVLAGIRRHTGVTYAALVPNLKGLERALAAGVDEVVIFLSASETHNQKNINKSISQALEAYGAVAARASGSRRRSPPASAVSTRAMWILASWCGLPSPWWTGGRTRSGFRTPRGWRIRGRCMPSCHGWRSGSPWRS